MERISPKVMNLSNIPLSSNAINVLKLGLSFTPTPKSNIPELEADIFNFIRKLRLTYHFRNSIYHDESIVKPTSTFTPKPNENQELEKICKTLMETEIKMKKTTDNISSLRNGLNSLIKRTTKKEIIIKPADKGSIITVMSPEFYLNMCDSHLRNEEYYECIQDNDPSPLLKNRIIAYAKKYKHLLTENEYKTLTQKTYKISNFCMLPKLHKSKELNDIILAKNSEYINVDKILTIEGRPIVAGPCYHTSVVSQILHVIMEPTLSFIKHILKDSFDFIDRIDTQCTDNTILSTCDIKSLYTNIQHDVFYKAIEYWIDKFHDDIPLLSRLTKAFILKGLNIILKFNYFFHQIKGTAMGTIFAVVGSNLTVAYFEVKMFALLPQIYPRDFVDYFVCNYFRFLDDIFHTWLINFDIEPFYKLINELDPDFKFIFEKVTTDINFLDINIKIVDNQLHFDIYHKPTNSFSYLKYNSCHPSHTKNNISLSLARRLIRIVTDNRDYRLEELRQNLLKRNHPEKIINYSFTKSFQPKNNKEENKEIITFT